MRTFSRRVAVGSSLSVLATSTPPLHARQPATPVATPAGDPATAVRDIVDAALDELALRGVLVHVAAGSETAAYAAGESLTGVPATPDMRVRNGAVAITYIAVVLLRLQEEGVLSIDDTVTTWLPDLPDAGQVTLRMLANMTSGYRDYVPNPEFVAAFYANPFRAWTTDELLALAFQQPRLFPPGENWDYAHTNYVILGLAMEAATGEPLEALLARYVLGPLGLVDTASEMTAAMSGPILHAYSSERRPALGIPPATPFYEESTFWDPSWTLARGAVQYSTVADVAASWAGIGRGELLSAESMAELLNRDLLGFGAPLDGCRTCRTFEESRLYGLGIWIAGGWIVQNPLFGGYAGVAAYHAGADIAIAVANTFAEAAFDAEGGYSNASVEICRRLSAAMVPGDPLRL